MINADAIREVITIYQKHGWILRRVLLSSALNERLAEDKDAIFGEVPVIESTTDAAWFSRPPKSGGVPWELRYLADLPFALLDNIDEDDQEFENYLKAVESRLSESVIAKETA